MTSEKNLLQVKSGEPPHPTSRHSACALDSRSTFEYAKLSCRGDKVSDAEELGAKLTAEALRRAGAQLVSIPLILEINAEEVRKL